MPNRRTYPRVVSVASPIRRGARHDPQAAVAPELTGCPEPVRIDDDRHKLGAANRSHARRSGQLPRDGVRLRLLEDPGLGFFSQRLELLQGPAEPLGQLAMTARQLLQELGIPNATFQIDIIDTELSPQGTDKIEILFSANKGIAPRPLAQVASGGEFSRLMFCIKYVMAEKTDMPTLVLDEIDSGVSGEVAFKLGSMMRKMSENHQLIAISHLPQIAARGNSHYFVYKDNTAAKTISSIKHLQDTERIEEIAKMIGGDKPSKVAFQNAQELLAQ